MVPIRPQFVVFGDSLTQQSFGHGGWGAALANTYARKADVVLRGYSGYNTRWALQLLEKVFPNTGFSPPKLVVIFFGANDAALPHHISARQHVPVEEYKENLKIIYKHLRLVGVPNIMFIAPSPVDEAARVAHNKKMQEDGAPDTPERTNSVTAEYAEGCKKVAASLGIPALDLWTLMMGIPDWQGTLLTDGLHFTPEAQGLVYEALQSVIDDKFPTLRAEDMPNDFPGHAEIDPADPGAAFA